MNIVHLLFSLNGRIRRRDYWLASLALLPISFGLQYAAYRFFGTADGYLAQMALYAQGNIDRFFYAQVSIILLMLWPSVALNTKRWHDRNRPGYLAFIFPLANFVSVGLSMAKVQIHDPRVQMASTVFSIVYGLFALWVFVECGFLDGTRGTNKYGSSPKGISNDVSAVF